MEEPVLPFWSQLNVRLRSLGAVDDGNHDFQLDLLDAADLHAC